MKVPVFFTLIVFTGLLFGCGGGGNTPAATSNPPSNPPSYTLSSIAEGGNSNTFEAEILQQYPSANSTGIILLHGRGGNPDSAVVRQLRYDLFNRGFTTLSIQTPVPATYTEGTLPSPPFQSYIDDVNGVNDVFPEAYARIRAAINELESKGITQVILIGFSMGSRMVSAHFANGRVNELPIVGVIGIGMYGTSIDPLNVSMTISSITVPVLDIYGSNDTNAVTTAFSRKTAYESSGIGILNGYMQAMLICDPGLTTSDCHKLVGLKGSDTSPLELIVFAWIANLINPVVVP